MKRGRKEGNGQGWMREGRREGGGSFPIRLDTILKQLLQFRPPSLKTSLLQATTHASYSSAGAFCCPLISKAQEYNSLCCLLIIQNIKSIGIKLGPEHEKVRINQENGYKKLRWLLCLLNINDPVPPVLSEERDDILQRWR